jgi:hypothetical protein
MTARKCKAINKDGSPCKGFAGADSFCFTHSPSRAKQRSAARKRGGRANKTPHSGTKAPARVRTMDDVLKLIDYALAETLILSNTLERGRLLVSIIGQYTSAIQAGDMEKRIENLEERIYGDNT